MLQNNPLYENLVLFKCKCSYTYASEYIETLLYEEIRIVVLTRVTYSAD